MSHSSVSVTVPGLRRFIILAHLPLRHSNDTYTFVVVHLKPEGYYDLPEYPDHNAQAQALQLLALFGIVYTSLPVNREFGDYTYCVVESQFLDFHSARSGRVM